MADVLSCPKAEPHELHGWGAGPPWHVCPGIPEPEAVEPARGRCCSCWRLRPDGSHGRGCDLYTPPADDEAARLSRLRAAVADTERAVAESRAHLTAAINANAAARNALSAARADHRS